MSLGSPPPKKFKPAPSSSGAEVDYIIRLTNEKLQAIQDLFERKRWSLQISTKDSRPEDRSTSLDHQVKAEEKRAPYAQFVDELLCKERQEKVQKERENLTKWLDVTDSIMIDKLATKGLLTQEYCEVINVGKSNEDRVFKLLDIMKRFTNSQFEELCNVLHDIGQGHVVRNLLLTDGDILHLQEKLARFFLTEYTDIRLYNTDKDDRPTPIEDVYVNMTWRQLNKDFAMTEEEHYASYAALFPKVFARGGTHVVVTGAPGAGKTTFVKRLCHQWAEHILSEEKTETMEMNFLHQYSVVIPLILRLIRTDTKLQDIINAQLSILSSIDLHTILSVLQKDPGSVLMLFDGYDELGFLTMGLKSILTKQNFPSMPVIVTSRPHSLTLLKHLGSKTVDQLVQICGFSDVQIRQYIEKCFKDDKTKGSRMFQRLQERSDLLEMASTAIHLEMMCTVWKSKEDLGRNLAELYERFTVCLLDHHEQRNNVVPRTPEAVIVEKYMSLFLATGTLANQWSKSSRLQTTFGYERLCQVTQGHTNDVIHLGCITKYHPSSTLDKSYWAFTHLTVQEYFLAFFLFHGAEDADILEFQRKCLNVNILLKLTAVFKFLVGMAPKKANDILANVIIKTEKEDDCNKLLGFLLEVMPEYPSPSDYNLPLPGFIDTDTMKDKREEFIKLMMERDHISQNAKSLKTDNLANAVLTSCLGYLVKLDLNIKSEKDMVAASNTIRHCFHVQSLKVDFLQRGNVKTDIFVSQIPKSLTSLTLIGTGSLGAASAYLMQGPRISELCITDKGDDPDKAIITTLCDGVHRCRSLTSFHLTVDRLSDTLLNLKQEVNVSLKVARITSQDLTLFVHKIEVQTPKPGMTVIDISGFQFNNRNLSECGREIGILLTCLKRLEALHMNYCNLRPETLARLTADMKQEDQQVKLKLLSMLGNELRGGSQQLAGLLYHVQQLHTLDAGGCKLHDRDMASLASALKQLKLLQNLRLSSNEIGASAAVALGELWPHLPDLQVLGMWRCQIEPASVPLLLHTEEQHRLHKLRVLDMGVNFLGDEGVSQLATYLPSLPTLQALSVAGLTSFYSCKDVKTLLHLATSLPPSLTHLDVSNNCGAAVVQMTQQKERLAQLDRLNIGDDYNDTNREETVEAIRQEMLTVNPDINVYYERYEYLWDIYVEANKE